MITDICNVSRLHNISSLITATNHTIQIKKHTQKQHQLLQMAAINEGNNVYPNIAATNDAAAPPAGANVVYVNQFSMHEIPPLNLHFMRYIDLVNQFSNLKYNMLIS